ncbi:hypothetical protein [Desertibacillus haloalkaliphilus]|uniref:hypothetical protein n=1 Tax=Desertibacillus haloalkaliphilus TaxID=1328930 RepID=UPI001C2703AD|nr:hypothetical protein [Desertibacillus haloalkaliphilus]MBU8908071.1 hypothetical protein [Desertibacillus haloalkaliphilus]
MKNLNPIFNEITNKKISNPRTNKQQRQNSKKRFDSRHDMKFPVSHRHHQLLRSYFKIHRQSNPTIITSQTIFNTILLRHSILHPQIVSLDREYKDTKRYFHCKPNQIEYTYIGGVQGIAIKEGISERQALYHMMISAIEHIESGGTIDHEAFKQIRPSK